MTQKIQLTQTQLNEVQKCTVDPVYFSKFIKLDNPITGLSDFQLYPFQKSIIRTFAEDKHSFLLKSRQIGGSTLSLIYALWCAMFHDYKEIGISTINYSTAKVFRSKLSLMYENLPDHIKVLTTVTHNDFRHIGFSSNSTIHFFNSSIDAFRGYRSDVLILDELAFFKNTKEFWETAAYCTLIPNGKFIINTSFNADNKFISHFWDDLFVRNNCNLMCVPWSSMPNRDLRTDAHRQENLALDMFSKPWFIKDDEIVKMWTWYRMTKDFKSRMK